MPDDRPYIELEFTGRVLTQYDSNTLNGTDIVIDYGDGTIINYTGDYSHTYTSNGTYTIRIYGVTSFGSYCFRECSGLKSVIIPESITSLTAGCFYNCSGLTSIVIPNSVTSLGYRCFFACTSLTSMIISDNITNINYECFSNCSSLTDIRFNWTSSTDILRYMSNWIDSTNSSLAFIIPYDTTSLYEAKGYPTAKLKEVPHHLFTDVKRLFLNNKEVKSIVIDETDGGIIYERTTTPIVLSSSSEIDYGQNVILNGSIPFDTNSIKIYQNDVLIGTTFSSNGVFSYTISNLNAGTYTFKAVFEGDEDHVEGESNGVVVTINKATPVLTLSSDKSVIHYNETVTLSGTTTVNGTIKIWQGGMTSPLTSIESVNGTFSYTFTIKRQGTIQVFATIDATDNYNLASSNIVTLTYSNSTNLTIEVPTLIYSDIFDVTGILTDEDNNPIPNASIKLYRDTSILEATETTNNNGEVTFHRSAPTSITTYTFQLVFDGDSSYSNSSSSVVTRKVNAETTILNLTSPLNNATYNEGETIPIAGTITTDDGEQLSSENPLIVTVYDENNNRLTVLPIVNGTFSRNITAPSSAGNHSITVKFEGITTIEEPPSVPSAPDEEPQEEPQEPQLIYAPSEATVNITVNAISLTPSSLTLNASKTILSSADAFKNWTQPFNMGIDEELEIPYLTPIGSNVALNNITFPSEFEINYRIKITTNSTTNSSLLFHIGRDSNNGILIGNEDNHARIYTRINNTNSRVAEKTNAFNFQNWADVTIRYDNAIISVTINNNTINYTLTDPTLINNYFCVYGAYSSNVRFADFEIIDLSDDSIVYSSSKNTSTDITATVLDENDNPCINETVTFHLGLHEIQRTTDNNGVATLDYSSKQLGDVPISATLNNLSDSLIIEDCNYYNDGTHINDLRIQSGVSCSSDGEWIVISKSSSGEQFVFPPNPLCCFTGSDNWEMSMKCKTSDYSGQALAIQMNGCNYGSYVGESQYWGYNNSSFFGYLSGSYTLLDTDKVTSKRENGYWKLLVNDNTLITTRGYSWSGLRTPELYTNSGRRQSIKEWKIKRNITLNNLELSSNKSRINIDNNETVTLTVMLTSLNLPVANKIITFKENNEIIGTATTNNNGVATYIYAPSDYGDYIISAECDTLSNSVSVNANDGSNILYYNSGADLSKISDFDVSGAWASKNNSAGTYTVSSDGEEWITISRSGGGNYGHIPITPLTGINVEFKINLIVEMIAYGDPYNASYSGLYALKKSNNFSCLYQWGYPFRICRSDKGSSDNWQIYSNDGNVSNGIYRYECIFKSDRVIHNLYDLNDTRLKTYTLTGSSLNHLNDTVEFGIHTDLNRNFRIKEIIAERLE